MRSRELKDQMGQLFYRSFFCVYFTVLSSHIFRNWLTEMYLTEMYLYRVKLWSSTSELYCTYSYITKFLSKTKFFIKTLCTFLQRIFSAWFWNVTWQKCLCSKMISDRPPQIVQMCSDASLMFAVIFFIMSFAG